MHATHAHYMHRLPEPPLSSFPCEDVAASHTCPSPSDALIAAQGQLVRRPRARCLGRPRGSDKKPAARGQVGLSRIDQLTVPRLTFCPCSFHPPCRCRCCSCALLCYHLHASLRCHASYSLAPATHAVLLYHSHALQLPSSNYPVLCDFLGHVAGQAPDDRLMRRGIFPATRRIASDCK